MSISSNCDQDTANGYRGCSNRVQGTITKYGLTGTLDDADEDYCCKADLNNNVCNAS